MSKFVHPLQLDQFFVGQPHLSIQISNPVGQIGFEKKTCVEVSIPYMVPTYPTLEKDNHLQKGLGMGDFLVNVPGGYPVMGWYDC